MVNAVVAIKAVKKVDLEDNVLSGNSLNQKDLLSANLGVILISDMDSCDLIVPQGRMPADDTYLVVFVINGLIEKSYLLIGNCLDRF